MLAIVFLSGNQMLPVGIMVKMANVVHLLIFYLSYFEDGSLG